MVVNEGASRCGVGVGFTSAVVLLIAFCLRSPPERNVLRRHHRLYPSSEVDASGILVKLALQLHS